MAQCAQAINDLANTVEVGSPVVSKLQEFATVVVQVKQQVVVVLQVIDKEEIKHQYKVRAALHDLKLVVEAATLSCTRWMMYFTTARATQCQASYN